METCAYTIQVHGFTIHATIVTINAAVIVCVATTPHRAINYVCVYCELTFKLYSGHTYIVNIKAIAIRAVPTLFAFLDQCYRTLSTFSLLDLSTHSAKDSQNWSVFCEPAA